MSVIHLLVNNLSKLKNSKLNTVLRMSTKSTPLDQTREEMKKIFLSGVEAVLPRTIIEKQLRLSENNLLIGNRSFPIKGDVYLIGFGKAVMNMVPGVEKVLGVRLKKGIVSVPKGSKNTIWKVQDFQNFPKLNGPVEYREGAENNQPDSESVSTTNDIMDLIKGLNSGDTLIVLISGGGSALLCMPKPSLQLKEKQEFCKNLQQAGANIKELNIVRKKLSVIKGGGLAKLAYPASVISLILSDIVGDPIPDIASGPTVYSQKSSDEVTSILKKYGLFEGLNWKIKDIVMSKEDIDDKTLLDEKSQFKHVTNIIIGNNSIAIEAAQVEAFKSGFTPITLRNDIEGNVSDVSSAYARLASLICMALRKSLDRETFFDLIKDDPILALLPEKIEHIYNLVDDYAGQRVILIGGGEPTVVVKGNGTGGRNQQLALQFSLDWLTKVKEHPVLSEFDVIMLSGGTDGQDGPTDAAGAYGYPAIAPIIHDLKIKLQAQIRREMVGKMNEQMSDDKLGKSKGVLGDTDEPCDPLALRLKVLDKLMPENVIDDNDTYNFYSRFKRGKDLLKTGLTGTNVMDLHIISIAKVECGCRLDFSMETKCPDPFVEHNLDFDPAEFEKHETVSQEVAREPELLNIKILDTALAESCCTKRRE